MALSIIQSFARQSSLPLDETSLFSSYASIIDYITNNGVAYPGQIIVDTSTNTGYIINSDVTAVIPIGAGLGQIPSLSANWNTAYAWVTGNQSSATFNNLHITSTNIPGLQVGDGNCGYTKIGASSICQSLNQPLYIGACVRVDGNIVGGANNTNSGCYLASVLGGCSNITKGICSTIINGGYNRVCSTASFIGAGCHLYINNDYASIVGGRGNTASGYTSFIGGGENNTIGTGGTRSSVIGGANNNASGACASIVGGESNYSTGDHSFIAGGNNNNDYGKTNVFILGSNINATQSDATYVNNLLTQGSVSASNVTTGHGTSDNWNTAYTWVNTNSAISNFTGVNAMSANIANLNVATIPTYIQPQPDSVFLPSFSTSIYTWTGVAMSSGGDVMIALEYGNRPWISTNGGANWNVISNAPASKNWTSVAMSSDGTKILIGAVSPNAVLYRSSNTGASWTAIDTSGARNWGSVAMSSNGSIMAAADNGGYLYISNNSGSTFSAVGSLGIKNWTGVAISSNGTTIVAVASNDYIYISRNSGSTWSQVSSSTSYSSVAISSDGTTITATIGGSYITVSRDSGNSWNSRAYNNNWPGVAMSSDGRIQVAVQASGYMYYSSDFGTTWTIGLRNSYKSWKNIAISADGTTFIASTTYGYGLYISYGKVIPPYGGSATINAIANPVSGNQSLLSIYGAASASSYLQLQNTVATLTASTDISVYNDQGYYLDMGINSSKYNGRTYYSGPFTIVDKNDGYIYNTNGNLALGTINPVTSSYVSIFAGGSLSGSPTQGGHEVVRFVSGGKVGIGTTTPNKNLTVVGDISGTGTITVLSGSSIIWNNSYNILTTTNRLANNLVAYWSFNENVIGNGYTDTNRYDSTGNGYTLSDNNGNNASYNIPNVTGAVRNTGYAVQFNGTDYFNGGSVFGVLGFGTTVSTWVKTTSAGYIINTAYFSISINSNGTVYFYYDLETQGSGTQNVSMTTTKKVNDGNWHHIVVVIDDSGGGSVYIDGVINAGVAWTYPYQGQINASNFTFGQNYIGYIDETAVWSRSLQPLDIAMLYNFGLARFYSEFTLAPFTISPTFIDAAFNTINNNLAYTPGIYDLVTNTAIANASLKTLTLTTTAVTASVNQPLLSIYGAASASSYLQIQNTAPTLSSSTDISVYNDQGYYLDVGINSSKYNGNRYYSGPFTITNNNDGYVYNTNGNLALGTINPITGSYVSIFAGGSLSGTQAQGGNEIARFLSGGRVGIGTSSPNQNLTVIGSISASNPIYDNVGNSTQWNNTYTQVNSNSAQWNNTYTWVNSNSANALHTTLTVTSTALTASVNQPLLSIYGAASASAFAQIQNTANTLSASTDISIYNNLGNYLDIGINSSSYNGNTYYTGPFTITGPGDGYLYSTLSNLAIGNTSNAAASSSVIIFAGGSLSGTAVKGGHEVARFLSGGRVGIGTSTPNTSLTVVGDISATGNVYSLGTGAYVPLSGGTMTNGLSAPALSSNNVYLVNSANPLSITANNTSTTDVVTIGLNSSTTNRGLVFYQNAASSGMSNSIVWKSNSGSIFDFARIDTSYGNSYTNSYMAFNVANSSKTIAERMRIDVNGNVGINTTTPSQALTVNGSISASGNLATNTNYTATAYLSADTTMSQNIDLWLPLSVRNDPNNWVTNTGVYPALSGKITPTIPGYYFVSYQAAFNAGSGTGQNNAQIRINGSSTKSIVQMPLYTTSGAAQTMTTTAIVYLNGVSDSINVSTYSSVAGQTVKGTSPDGNWTKVEVYKIN
jgi:Concanavalin A-like lectin/glucanases superfamily